MGSTTRQDHELAPLSKRWVREAARRRRHGKGPATSHPRYKMLRLPTLLAHLRLTPADLLDL